MLLLSICGVVVLFGPYFVMHISRRKREAGCFTLVVLLVQCDVDTSDPCLFPRVSRIGL